MLCTTFAPYKFRAPKFAEQAIEQLDKDFDSGAVAVKIWKNLGMEIRKSDGSFLMADDRTHPRGPPDPNDPDNTGYLQGQSPVVHVPASGLSIQGEKVQAFLMKYQDRVLCGTDLILPRGAKKSAFDEWRRTYARDWGLFATDQVFELEGRKFRGVKLPDSVVRKIFHDNALKWIPGIAGN